MSSKTERLVVVMIKRSKQSFKKQTMIILIMILAAAFEVVDLFLLFH